MKEKFNIILREWRIEDARALTEIMNNKNVLDNLRDLPLPYTEKNGLDYINLCLNADKSSRFDFAVVSGEQVVGSISVLRQPNIHRRTAELGYCIGENFWNKGVATEAVGQVCKYVFESTDIVRIYAEPFAENAASCRVLEKNGFELEGVLRKNAVKNGVLRDMKMYSLIKE